MLLTPALNCKVQRNSSVLEAIELKLDSLRTEMSNFHLKWETLSLVLLAFLLNIMPLLLAMMDLLPQVLLSNLLPGPGSLALFN